MCLSRHQRFNIWLLHFVLICSLVIMKYIELHRLRLALWMFSGPLTELHHVPGVIKIKTLIKHFIVEHASQYCCFITSSTSDRNVLLSKCMTIVVPELLFMQDIVFIFIVLKCQCFVNINIYWKLLQPIVNYASHFFST